MSAHRSPGGRRPHPGPGLLTGPVGAPRPARSSTSAVATAWPPPAPTRPAPAGRHRAVARNGMASAAAGALAVALPTIPVGSLLPTPPDAADAADRAAESVVLRPVGEVGPDTPERRLLATLAPVTADAEPETVQLQVSDLVKAAGLADAARVAEEEERIAQQERIAQEAAREAAAGCDADPSGLGAVKPWVRDGARFLSCLYDEPTLIGVASRSGGTSDHPSGHALDLMTGRAQGDAIAACVLANQDELGVDYVIWRQRVNHGGGWESMADRGDDTANHYDHVHVSFKRSAPGGAPSARHCG